MRTAFVLFAAISLLGACSSETAPQTSCDQELCVSQPSGSPHLVPTLCAGGMKCVNHRTQHLVLETGNAPVNVTRVDFNIQHSQAFRDRAFWLNLTSPRRAYGTLHTWHGELSHELSGGHTTVFTLDPPPLDLDANTRYRLELWLPLRFDAHSGLYGESFMTIVQGFGTESGFHTCPQERGEGCWLVGDTITFARE